jgi:hypothetical protein
MEKSLTLTDLSMYLAEIKALAGDFNTSECMPGKMAVKNILGYARAVASYKTQSTGDVHLLMN